jgi:ubiquinone/menaquinone biosynthesis C-methylase UbiE
MKIDARPQNLLEWIALKLNLVPIPLGHSHMMFTLSRAVLEATRLNVFEAAKDSPVTLEEIAAKCELNTRALHSLLHVLVSAGYFKYRRGKYELTRLSKKWCLKDGQSSVYNQQIFNLTCWRWMDYMGEFLKTGKGLQYHETLTEEEWKWYQLGMEDVSRDTAKAAPKNIPLPSNPTSMLDIGGSHGLYSVELCKKYPTLSSTILDLPQAVEKARPILARYGMGDRVQYWTGDALKEDLEENKYDLVLVSSLMHHFTFEQNNDLAKRVSKALKPGGTFVIQEFTRPEEGDQMDMIGTISDLFFNLSSTSGTWSLKELKAFQSGAGLQQPKVNRFITIPGYVQICARKNR